MGAVNHVSLTWSEALSNAPENSSLNDHETIGAAIMKSV
ncbi:hypothetical protein BN2476_680071 [Paraburkholderia piptadeniae]|uniref:Uncharacterized protein n=1 Tax=Paraburkholderia piptadeniae TaxID=1701573 RepID=A0A1N7SPG3_9BURK|nr:hypothetical protein BN2476_680071 [Paraburkholderia piptadeniae]